MNRQEVRTAHCGEYAEWHCRVQEANTMTALTALSDLRVWRDERLGQLWRVAYNEGDHATYVTFPDVDALNDFLHETLGLDLLDEPENDTPYVQLRGDTLLDLVRSV